MEVAKEAKFQVVLVRRSDNRTEFDPNLANDTPVIENLGDIEFIDDVNQPKDCC